MCRSICISGQCALLILTHDLREVPTLRMCESNTDAVQFEIDEEYLPQVQQIIDNWQVRYRLELEREDVVKLVMKDVNNYCCILKTDKGLEVKFKGGCFAGCPNIVVHEDGRLETIYQNSFKANSMVVVAEAVLKYLLFKIPIETTIMKNNDIFNFQQITHLGGTYAKCVQESPNGDIELQRNNRIYAGKVPSGTIVKIKPDGRRDSLANCPDNPLVDNANKCTIDMINKKWYIEIAKQRVEDFLGTGKQILKGRKKLMKKDELIEENEKQRKRIEELEELLENGKKENIMETNTNVLKKINELRKDIRATEFVLDSELPSNLGGKEYHSIGQYYDALQDGCIKYGLDFSFETIEVINFIQECIKPVGKMPIHLATVRTKATLTDIDSGDSVSYYTIGQGSDSMDKAIAGAETSAFRQWFTKNFSPKKTSDDVITNDEVKSSEPKVPTFIPPKVKEEITKEVVSTPQQESNDQEDIDSIVDTIMEIRSIKGDATYGAKTLEQLQTSTLSSADILQIKLKVENRLDELKQGA